MGGAGYIGTHTAIEFIARGHVVGVYDNLSTGLIENIQTGTEFYEGDILDTAALDAVLKKGWDAVVHLAAFKAAGESMTAPSKYARNNITGSLNIITGCIAHGIRHFVLSSSAAVYGEPQYLPVDEEHPTDPENYYGYTKLAIERHLNWFSRLHDFNYASLRYFNAAGYDPSGRMTGLERNPANLIPVVMETAVGRRKALQIFGDDYDTEDGTGVRDYIHVTDLSVGHSLALEHIAGSNTSLTVNLGSERGISVLSIVESARRITGREIPLEFVSRRPGDPAKLVASSSKAKQLLGWEAQYSSVDSIISSTWAVYSGLLK